jgi:hypothetical protein
VVGSGVFGLVPARLEHRKHSIGDRKAAGGVARAEQDGNEADRLLLHRARVQQREDSTDHDDTMHEVGALHQRCVQDRRHIADDDPAGKTGEHENVQGYEAGDMN